MTRRYDGGRRGTVLGIAIAVALLPFVIVYNTNLNRALLMPMVAVATVAVCLMVLGTFWRVPIGTGAVAMALLLGLCHLVTLILNSIRGTDTNSLDLVNAVVRPLNVVLFVGLIGRAGLTCRDLQKLSRIVVAIGLLASIVNTAEHVASIPSLLTATSIYQVNFKGFFPNRNQFGLFLFLSIVALDYGSAHQRQKWAGALRVLFGVNLVLSFSRGALLALLIYELSQAIFARKIARFVTVVGVLGMAVLIATRISGVEQFVTNSILRPNVGVTGRSDIWEIGMSVVTATSVIWGVGLFTGLDLADAIGMTHDQFHSLYVDTLVMGGILGLSWLIALFLFVNRRSVRVERCLRCRSIYAASIAGIAALSAFESIGFFSIGFVDTVFTIFVFSAPLMLNHASHTAESVEERSDAAPIAEFAAAKRAWRDEG